MNPQRFNQLFRQALHIIKARTDKNLRVVMEEISYEITGEKGGTVENWLYKERIPSDPAMVRLLGQALFERGGLSEAELKRFYQSADYLTLAEPEPAFNPAFFKEPKGPVALDDPFYIRREHVDDILTRQVLGRGTTTVIQGTRQTGKTSLLARGVDLARKQEDMSVVYFSLQDIVDSAYTESLENFLYYLFARMVRILRPELLSQIKTIWHEMKWLTAREALTELMEQHLLNQNQRILLAIDEGDVLIPTDFPDAFFSYIRSWCDKRGGFNEQWHDLNLVLVISTEASFLIKNLAHSPFFNVATAITTRDFDETQVRRLNQYYHNRLQAAEVSKFMDLLGGHPFLTRMALYKLSLEKEWQWTDLAAVALNDDGPFGPHLYYYGKLLRDKPPLQAGLLEVIKSQRCSDEEILYKLMQAGLVKKIDPTGYTCRCGLYSQYFENKLQ